MHVKLSAWRYLRVLSAAAVSSYVTLPSATMRHTCRSLLLKYGVRE